jgi:DNA-binding NarL/FixJ family response regulator
VSLSPWKAQAFKREGIAKIRVLLADDHPITLAGIRYFFRNAADIEIVAEARSSKETLELIERFHPNVVLLDVEMPDISGIEVAQRLKQQKSPVRCLMLSGYEDVQYVRNALVHGAWGYLTKDAASERIVEAVRGIAAGRRGWMSQRTAEKLSVALEFDRIPADLTPREKEVLRLIVAGNTNHKIGHALQISQKTVEKHVGAILNKLGVHSRVDAAVMAVRYGTL